jgi:sulfite oxidase
MRTELHEVEGIDWFDGAVQNCMWEGPLLCDVLNAAGIDQKIKKWNEDAQNWEYDGHLECVAVSELCEEAPVYGGSVPLSKVMDPTSQCILATSINGNLLDANRGCPVRAVFPGIIGARWVKWVSQLTVRIDESQNHYQQHDYKKLPPQARDKESAEKFWALTPPMMDVPINSVIGIPNTGSVVKRDEEDMVTVRGYAIPEGSDGPVTRVEVSADKGETWVDANLDFGEKHHTDLEDIRWSWCLWTARVKMPRGSGQRLVSRVTDLKGNVQPEESSWNVRGVGYNAWGECKDLEVV